MNDELRQCIEWRCQRLALQASNLMDANDFAGMVALFTEDCEFVRPSTYPHQPMRGRKDILAITAMKPKDIVSRHVCSNLVIEVLSEDHAVGHSYFTHFCAMRLEDGTKTVPLDLALRSVGEYRDEFVRTPEGWRIARRVGRFIFGGV